MGNFRTKYLYGDVICCSFKEEGSEEEIEQDRIDQGGDGKEGGSEQEEQEEEMLNQGNSTVIEYLSDTEDPYNLSPGDGLIDSLFH